MTTAPDTTAHTVVVAVHAIAVVVHATAVMVHAIAVVVHATAVTVHAIAVVVHATAVAVHAINVNLAKVPNLRKVSNLQSAIFKENLMTRLTHTTLERRAEALTVNGRQPAAQAVIAGVGYDPAVLDQGAALLDAMRRSRTQKQAALAAQKEATGREAQARRAAGREIASLKETARALFAADIPTLTALGLLTRYTRADGQRRASRPSEAAAERIQDWRQLLDNARALDGDVAAQLAAAGWPVERLEAAAALVEAYAAADTAQQAAIQTGRQAAAQHKADAAALRAWYTRAARLIQIAIRDDDPADAAQLRDLLGLNL